MFRDGVLKGKRILVTGGGTGLGREMTAKYLELGADLTICGRRKSVLDKTAGELMAKHGGSVKTFVVDIRDAQGVDAMVQAIWDDGGPLTGLVNNAAGNFISRTEDLSPRGFDAIANIVFHGTFYVTHAVGKRWIAGGHKGSVVSIVVTWVWTGSPFVVPSAMSKAGVHVMTQSLAVEWGRYGIRLNAIAPGIFPTEGAGLATREFVVFTLTMFSAGLAAWLVEQHGWDKLPPEIARENVLFYQRHKAQLDSLTAEMKQGEREAP
jgi:NAD(P)-dependent dehydrogenase (short-subunit alcohol dehydrogenase family)